jgi:hypothetical protein
VAKNSDRLFDRPFDHEPREKNQRHDHQKENKNGSQNRFHENRIPSFSGLDKPDSAQTGKCISPGA